MEDGIKEGDGINARYGITVSDGIKEGDGITVSDGIKEGDGIKEEDGIKVQEESRWRMESSMWGMKVSCTIRLGGFNIINVILFQVA